MLRQRRSAVESFSSEYLPATIQASDGGDINAM
jgi:hypothetical protein